MPVTFTKVKLPHGWLGNMAGYAVIYKGQRWASTEALFQALRFDDETIREEIRAQKSPMAAKLIAKRYADKMTVEPKSEQDLANMEICLDLKLTQHPELKERLLATGDDVIIEDVSNRPDGGRHTFWGAAKRNGEWVGENALGKLWMKKRQQLRGDNGQNVVSNT